jgi:glycosyltransferase involved in cell wall biosynthesis
MIIPVSAVIPTKDRAKALRRTLESLIAQGVGPAELIIVDGSAGTETSEVVAGAAAHFGPGCSVTCVTAKQLGAAAQRIQGVASATQPYIWFFDDDILFEPDCVARLWSAISSDLGLGGVSAMIVNQRYVSPGRLSATMFQLMHGRKEESYAGKVIGPAINLLPEDRADLPEVVPVQWLNTGCTIYRRVALPEPVFDPVFVGYSMFEDVALSLRVGAKWTLANARTARIFHDSQPGAHKSDPVQMAEMEFINRYYVMTKLLDRTSLPDHVRLIAWEGFGMIASLAATEGRRHSFARLRGTLRGLWSTVARRSSHTGTF